MRPKHSLLFKYHVLTCAFASLTGRQSLLFIGIALCCPTYSNAQPWSGILNPVSGAGACTQGNTTTPDRCAIDWTTAGIPGGIPSRATICATINASSYGNGTVDATTGVQNALDSCPSGQVVSLSAGTFLINTHLTVPSNVTLRGQGADQTILNAKGTSGQVVVLGTGGPNLYNWPSLSVTGGATAGSTSITVSSASSLSVGEPIVINELNPSWVTINGGEGSCTWCDGLWKGTRAIGQIDRITSISGNIVGLEQPLFITYTNTPQAAAYPNFTISAGVENLQIYANNTGYSSNFKMSACLYCWISGVEGNYADGDHVEIEWSYHSEVINSYFSNSFGHTPGSSDADVALRYFSTGLLIQNNILERLHTSIMSEWAAAGNVIAYNYGFGNYDSGSTNFVMDGVVTHGANPMFHLVEGNIMSTIGADSIWGSASDNTFFRNWAVGTTKVCSPETAGTRAAVSCTGSNGVWAFQAARAINLTFLNNNYNFIGNIAGTSQSLVQTYSPYPTLTKIQEAVALCGPLPCGSGSRTYDTSSYDYSIGYGESSDNGTGGTTAGAGCNGALAWTCHSLTPYNTVFMHGEYSNAANSTTWSNGVSQTLPPSFYLTVRPSWWGNTPYPAIGPDLTGGAGPGGHVNPIPAQNCYINVMGGTDGTGSPLAFNASKCYAPLSAPAPPSALTAVSQ